MGGKRQVVLVGGGHSHVQVLRGAMMHPLPEDVQLTVVVNDAVSVYSGMVPGVVAGQYATAAVEIDVRPLARLAGARVIEAAATRIDHAGKRVELAGRAPLPYELCSLNVGSTVAGTELPGVREHAIPTRPINRLVREIDALCARLAAEPPPADAPFPVVVVGAGAGGVELAFSLRQRLADLGVAGTEVTLAFSSARVLPGQPAGLVARVERAALERGIKLRPGQRVVAVTEREVRLADGSALPASLVVWVGGAVAHPLARDSGLPVDARGFVLVRDTLEVEGAEGLFAVGDCCVPAGWREIPKAGVYAVRQGPVLTDNLRRQLIGEPLLPYDAQRDFLLLLNIGGGRAIGQKFGWTFEGEWVFRLKDWIDRSFMEKFQVLAPEGDPAPAFRRGLPVMPEMEFICGGCAAKVGETPLKRALARLAPPVAADDVVLGLRETDDAVAVERGGELLVSNLDAFTAFTDDPWLVGRVAAANAASDLQAKGVDPRQAMAIVNLPDDVDHEETLFQLLDGARSLLDAEGCALLGGHTTVGEQLSIGFWVQGYAPPGGLWPLAAARPGDALVLSRALGTGALFHADMAGRAAGPWIRAATQRMARGNGPASRAAREPALAVRAATDVTGFGLAGHLAELVRAAGCSARLDVAALPALPGVERLLAAGERSTFHPQNRELHKALRIDSDAARHPRFELLFDPQTAGGLLFCAPPEQADALIEALVAAGETDACRIGELLPARDDGAPLEVIASG